MKLITLLSLVTILFSCKSSKFEKTTPFQVKKATYQNWVGGQPGIHGIKIAFQFSNLKENVKFQQVYFKNTKEQLYIRNNDKNTVVTANINTSTREDIDLIMHKDANKEYGNKLPKTKIDFPFELNENECVISYLINEKEKFYKLVLTKEKDAFYP